MLKPLVRAHSQSKVAIKGKSLPHQTLSRPLKEDVENASLYPKWLNKISSIFLEEF